jgi:peptidase E
MPSSHQNGQAPKQIIALGGGGFSQEPDNPLLDRFVLDCAGTPRPRICFVPTASGDAQGYIDKFNAAFEPLDCVPSCLSLFKPPTADLRSFVLEQDIGYVGGGNTKCLMALWREWGLNTIFREAWEAGVVLSGISAGSICWFGQGITDSIPGELTVLPCLGLLQGSNCPHYDGEPERRPAYHRLLQEGAIANGYAVDDGAALHFVGADLKEVISSRPQARAYRMERIGEDMVSERPLPTRYLGEGNRTEPPPEGA